MAADAALISETDGAPVETVNADGAADLVLVCEHASNRVPAALADLGLDAATLDSHVAWDPGAAGLARAMSRHLDAPLVLQRFSRLVFDCNRPLEAASAIPARSEVYDVPGNAGLSEAERRARFEAVCRPFHDAVADVVAARVAAGRPPAIVTVHTFTPVYLGERRETQLGILHDADSRLADALLALAEGTGAAGDLVVHRNSPYGPADGVTHTLKLQALNRGLPNVMFEVRNDLVRETARQAAMAERLGDLTLAALGALSPTVDPGTDGPSPNASNGG